MGDMAIAPPGPPLQRQAGGALADGQQMRSFGIGIDRGDAMLGLGPGHMVEQPGAGRNDREIRRFGLGHGGEADLPVLQRERLPVGQMQAAYRQQVATATAGQDDPSTALSSLINGKDTWTVL